jgi:hypothetical protein
MGTKNVVVLLAISATISTPDLAAQQATAGSPIVKRTTSAAEASLFRNPDVVVMLRVSKSCESEVNSDAVDDFKPREAIRQYTSREGLPILINAREPNEPDVSRDTFTFVPREGDTALKVGHTYVLFLNAVRSLLPNSHYEIAHPQMGFEVSAERKGFRVTPIIRGGALDEFDGRLLDDVIKEIQTRK